MREPVSTHRRYVKFCFEHEFFFSLNMRKNSRLFERSVKNHVRVALCSVLFGREIVYEGNVK